MCLAKGNFSFLFLFNLNVFNLSSSFLPPSHPSSPFFPSFSLFSLLHQLGLMLNRSDESRDPCLVPSLERKLMIFQRYGLFRFQKFPSIPSLQRDFLFIINRCWNLSNSFCVSNEMVTWFMSFILLIWITALFCRC